MINDKIRIREEEIRDGFDSQMNKEEVVKAGKDCGFNASDINEDMVV